MARRQFNWTLAIVLVVAVAVFAGAVAALHHWQKGSRAERSRPLGERAYDQENWDEAAEQLSPYVEFRPDDIPVLLKYADAQLRRRPRTQGHVGRAVSTYQSILRMDAGNVEAAKRLIELYLAGRQPQWQEAEKTARKYLQSRDDPEVRQMLARALYAGRKYAEAVKVLVDLTKDRPDVVQAYEMLGLLALERPTDVNTPAAEWLDNAVAANPQSAMAYIARGAFRSRPRRRDEKTSDVLQRLGQAMPDFEQAAKCDLSDADTHLRLVQELNRIQAFDKAKEQLAILQTKMPKKVSLWQSWAAAVLPGGSPQEKTTVAENGLKELAAYPWDFLPTATELFAAANQPEKAQECVSRMRERGMQPELLTFLDGLVAASRSDLWTAATCWRNVVGQGLKEYQYAGGLGAKVAVRAMLAATYSQLGDLQSANVQLRTLLTEDPTSIEGRLALARLMVRMGNWAGVQEQAAEVQRLVPDHAEAMLLRLQSRIFLLAADTSTPNIEQAWQELEKQLAQLDQTMGGSVQVKYLLAQVMTRQKKAAEAIKLLQDVRSKNPSDFRATLMEVEVLAAQDKIPEATALARTAMEQSPQAMEPVRALALLLNRQNDHEQCESVIKQAIVRMPAPEARRDLGLLLASLYRSWSRENDLQQWLTDLAGQFPNDIQIKRQLLACSAVATDNKLAQPLVDQIKALEGQAGWQWRYEQARIWVNPAIVADSDVFRNRYYSQVVTMLQENLQANPNDLASRLLLAAAHDRGNQKQLALSAYREAYSRAPNDIVVVMQMVSALQRNGEQEKAEDILKEASARELHHAGLDELELQGQRMRWRDQARRGDFESASDTLRQLVQKEPNDVDSRLALATVYMAQGQLDDAEVILKGLETRASESISIAQATVQLHVLRGNAQAATALCDQMVQKKPDLAAAYLLRARTYVGLRDYEKASADFAQAVAKAPDNAGVWVARARFYQVVGRRDEAIQDVRKALALSTKDPSVLNDAIPLCLTAGSPRLAEEAEATLDKAYAADSNDPGLKLLKSQFLLSRGTKSAITQGQRLLREITVARPQLSQAWHLLGRLELEQGEPVKALDMALTGLSHNERDRDLLLLKADAEEVRSPALAVPTLQPLLKQYPNDVQIERRLARALYRSGNRNDGRAILEARVKADPDNPIPPTTLAGLLASDERWTEVAELVANWVAKHPQDSFVVSTVARSLSAQGSPEAIKLAESLLTAAMERTPKSIPVVTSLAMLVQQMGRVAESVALNRKVIELDPNNIVALNNLAWALCEQNEQYEEALKYANQALSISPYYVDVLETRGVIFYRLGQADKTMLDKAAEDLSRCIELYPENARSLASAYFHLARVYADLRRPAQAQQALKEAMVPTRHLPPEEQSQATLLRDRLLKGL